MPPPSPPARPSRPSVEPLLRVTDLVVRAPVLVTSTMRKGRCQKTAGARDGAAVARQGDGSGDEGQPVRTMRAGGVAGGEGVGAAGGQSHRAPAAALAALIAQPPRS